MGVGRAMEIADLRNIREVRLELGPGLNVFVGRNAQGKTSLLEAVALLARGRSFRTEDMAHAHPPRGRARCRAPRRSRAHEGDGRALEVERPRRGRRLRVDGREVPPRAYQGRLEVVVYSTRPAEGGPRPHARAAAVRRPAGGRALAGLPRRRCASTSASSSSATPPSSAAARDLRGLGRAARARCGAAPAPPPRRLRRAAAARASPRGFRPGGERYAVAPARRRRASEAERAARAAPRSSRQRARDEQRGAAARLAGPHRDAGRRSPIDGAGRGARRRPRARRAACCWPWPGQPGGLSRRRRDRRRWRSSTISIPSSTRSARPRCAPRWRGAARPWSRPRTRAGRAAARAGARLRGRAGRGALRPEDAGADGPETHEGDE